MENQKMPLFGSQLIDSNSKTPYSDATQVNFIYSFLLRLTKNIYKCMYKKSLPYSIVIVVALLLALNLNSALYNFFSLLLFNLISRDCEILLTLSHF